MEDFNKLIELDVYFRYYELYKKYVSNIHTQYKSLLDIKNKIDNILIENNDESYQHFLYEKFSEAMRKINMENENLKISFNNFDFDKEKVLENINDYKILSYQFVKKNLNKYLKKHIEKYGIFDNENALKLYLNKIEMLLWDFFSKNFISSKDMLNIFDTAKNDILTNEYIKYKLIS